MSGSALRSACVNDFLHDVDRILEGAQDISLMRSPIGTGVQSDGWVRRKSVQNIIADKDHLGNAAVHICVNYRRPECLAKILEIDNVDPNLHGQGGYSPAVMACHNDEGACLRLLLEAGVDVNQRDDIGWTLLHHAAANRSQRALSVLLERETPGAKFPIVVDTINEAGHTPLMLACINDDEIAIKNLVLSGADPSRLHTDSSTAALSMCASTQAREACLAALEVRKEILVTRAAEEEERRRKEAFRETLKREAEEGRDENYDELDYQ